MRTVDSLAIRAPAEQVYEAAADVERWPEFLPHYRWVRVRDHRLDCRVVEMAAWRPFGLFKYPTWWVSEMRADPSRLEVHHRHIDGVTRGMDVVWAIEASDAGSDVSIVHQWDGPAWPLLRRPAADWVIGPVFIHAIASQTLAGIARRVERRAD